jgi:F-type H+-transporting ATPase subunit b
MSSDRQPPAEKASTIINSVPSTSLATRTGTVVLGTGLLAAAISQELYVVNEETVILVGTAILFTYIAKVRFSLWLC